MFGYCDNLESFNSNLSSLIGGDFMFYGCSKLTTFISDLGALQYGMNMFSDCSLSTESLKNIADTIYDFNVTSVQSRLGEGTGWIDIGLENTTPSELELTYIEKMQRKGWSVCINGTDMYEKQ